MAQRFWNGYQWRRISDTEARLRRARGEDVVDGDEPDRKVAPPTPAAQPVLTLDEILPPAPRANVAPLGGSPQDFDLSDDELEKLTAPGTE